MVYVCRMQGKQTITFNSLFLIHHSERNSAIVDSGVTPALSLLAAKNILSTIVEGKIAGKNLLFTVGFLLLTFSFLSFTLDFITFTCDFFAFTVDFLRWAVDFMSSTVDFLTFTSAFLTLTVDFFVLTLDFISLT